MSGVSLAAKALAGLVAGGFTLAGCASIKGLMQSSSSSEFQMECAKRDGVFASHECTGKNSCKGYEYQNAVGVSQHDCKGQSHCKGVTCKD